MQCFGVGLSCLDPRAGAVFLSCPWGTVGMGWALGHTQPSVTPAPLAKETPGLHPGRGGHSVWQGLLLSHEGNQNLPTVSLGHCQPSSAPVCTSECAVPQSHVCPGWTQLSHYSRADFSPGIMLESHDVGNNHFVCIYKLSWYVYVHYKMRRIN